jgi:hypothetical protein
MRWQVIVHYAYKIERNSPRSRFYVIRKLLSHDQLLNVHIEASNLGLVSNLLSYPEAPAACASLNRTPSQANAPELEDVRGVSFPVGSQVADRSLRV